MTKLSTFGWILHDLGLASVFGGTLFGTLAMNQAIGKVSSKEERGKVLNTAWNGYNLLNAVALGTTALTWLTGRKMLSGRAIDEETHHMVLAKDALLTGAVLTGAASALCGALLAKQAPEGATPVERGNRPAPETGPKAAKLMRIINALSPVNLALTAGLIGITSALAMKSSRSHRFSFISHLLP